MSVAPPSPSGKAHLRRAMMSHEEALRVHGLCRHLKKLDVLEQILTASLHRSRDKFSANDSKDEFTDYMEAPDIICEFTLPRLLLVLSLISSLSSPLSPLSHLLYRLYSLSLSPLSHLLYPLSYLLSLSSLISSIVYPLSSPLSSILAPLCPLSNLLYRLSSLSPLSHVVVDVMMFLCDWII